MINLKFPMDVTHEEGMLDILAFYTPSLSPSHPHTTREESKREVTKEQQGTPNLAPSHIEAHSLRKHTASRSTQPQEAHSLRKHTASGSIASWHSLHNGIALGCIA